MKQKSFISVIILIALLAITTGSALADGVVTGMTASRTGALTLTFTVTGYLSSAQLNDGYVQVQGGDSYKLNCVQKDEFTVICHAPGKIASGVTVGFGGSTFWVEKEDMPEKHVPAQYCYEVWDWFPENNYAWVDVGPLCQDAPANDGDKVDYYVAQYNYTETVQFIAWDVSGECPDPVPYVGPAYYYPFCPGSN